MEPVDPQEAPDYYKVIKDPMGKSLKIHLIFSSPLVMKYILFLTLINGKCRSC